MNGYESALLSNIISNREPGQAGPLPSAGSDSGKVGEGSRGEP